MASVSGSCICKKVAYTYTGEPTLKAVCHCRECQKLTGSSYTYNFLIPRENFKWTSGTPKAGKFVQEIGVEVDYSFCPDCGTVLIKQSEADMFKPFFLVQAGTIDGDEFKTKPDAELWTSRKVEWIDALNGVEQKAQFT
ncbi:Mss4-like protein [Mariannaea sp. PMI_226]|nr:Mss4-like protein [Mariannaea sp. PMI_226]